jgi:uncharacterized protein (TIRG00374 family)
MESNESSNKRQVWIGIAISVVCLAALFLFIDPAEILNALGTARFDYLALSAVGLVVFMLLRAIRWRFMLNNAASWSQVYHIQNIGYMLTQLLPLRLGDVARAVLIGSVPPVTIAQGVSTMVVERMLDLLFFIVLLPFTLAKVETLPAWMQSYARGLGVATLGIIVVLIIAANSRPFIHRITTLIFGRVPFLNTENWVNRVDGLLAGLNSLTKARDGLILIFLSITVWAPILFAYQMALTAVYIQTTWIMTAFVVCTAAFSVAAPSSPGQVGVFHAAVTFALVQVLKQPEGASASFAFLYHALNMVLMIILGLIGLFRTGSTFSHVVASARRFRQKTAT